MSFASGVYFTNKGRVLQAKAQTGVTLNFTRLGVGDGQLSGQDISELTSLIHEVKSLNITSFRVLTGGKASIGGVLSNQGLATGFYWREIGLFATDPDLGEILYCYGNAGALAEYIPAGGGSEILEKQVAIVSIIGNAQNVSATIEQSLIYETPAGAQAKADAAQAAAKAYTDQQIVQVDNVLAAHLADGANKHKASNISVTDSSNYFTATDVEGCLTELFTNVSDGKTLVATAITDKGISASGSDTFQQLHDKIDLIGSIKSIQRGSFSTNTATPIDITINTVVPENCLILYQFVGATSGYITNRIGTFSLTSATNLRFDWAYVSGGGTGTIYWQVIEFTKVKSSQGGVTTASNSPVSVSISSVNTAKSLCWITWKGSNNNRDIGYYNLSVHLTSDTQITIYTGVSSGAATRTIRWQVIEFN